MQLERRGDGDRQLVRRAVTVSRAMPASERRAHALVVAASSVQAFAPRPHTQLAMLVLARRLHVGGLELAKPLPNVEAPLGNLPPCPPAPL